MEDLEHYLSLFPYKAQTKFIEAPVQFKVFIEEQMKPEPEQTEMSVFNSGKHSLKFKVVQGDVLNLEKHLAGNHIKLAIIDVPYGILHEDWDQEV